jgi:2-dehydropantoate 2-reductase
MNRQVPANYYLIIGRGRLATHLAHYFHLKNISFLQWSRLDSTQDLEKFVALSKRIFVAISDDAIENFIITHQLPLDKTIHFSGALTTSLALQLHPLMTFSPDLYDLATYEAFCFVSPQGSPGLYELIPELQNPHYFIPAGHEAFYHALCVLSGNGTTLLWQNVLEQFQKNLSIPPSALWPYLEQIVFNLQKNPYNALTGPWVRHDQKTIQKNEKALQSSSLSSLYRSLTETYNKSFYHKGVSHENRP